MPSRIWFILAAIWIAGALAWFSWTDYALAHNVAAIACGYPDTAAKDYATCLTAKEARTSAAMWNQFFAHDCLWALVPAFALLIFGSLMRRRRVRA
ncbi:MAG TPA: hypothetical protein VII56_23275 [Rhizomicrobium sp.]